jgi:intein/homing endonuclease
MQQTAIKDLFLDMGYDYRSMKINERVDVSDKGYYIQSFSLKENKNEEKLIKNIISKNDSTAYVVFLENGNLFKVSLDHKMLISWEKDISKLHYVEVRHLINAKENYYTYSEDGEFLKTNITKTEEVIPILDLEVEDFSNYFSEGVVSHNTIFGNPETTCVHPSTEVEIMR